MRVHNSLSLLCLLLFLVSSCNADDDQTATFEVVGIGECADCKENNFKTSQAFSGLHVTIDCKLKTGENKRVGAGDLDEEGKFKVSLPREIVQDGRKLKHECYTQLHSAVAIPCPAHNGLEATKIVFKSLTDKKTTFTPTKNVRFSSAICTSKFLWPYFKYPPLPNTHSNWKKKFPKITFPPLKNHWPLPPLPPLYKPKPLPPSIPIYKPPVVKPPVPIYKPKPKPNPPVYKPPVVKPKPPSVPIYKPKPPVYKPPVVKPKPPSVPIYKPKPPVYKPPVVKPLPPPHVPSYKPNPPVYKPPVVKPLPPPIYKPNPPVYKPKPKPPVPIYKPPIVTKPLPPPIPLFPLPPFYKKPCPPLPKIPKNYFQHPKFGYFPPLPPSIPQP